MAICVANLRFYSVLNMLIVHQRQGQKLSKNGPENLSGRGPHLITIPWKPLRMRQNSLYLLKGSSAPFPLPHPNVFVIKKLKCISLHCTKIS